MDDPNDGGHIFVIVSFSSVLHIVDPFSPIDMNIDHVPFLFASIKGSSYGHVVVLVIFFLPTLVIIKSCIRVRSTSFVFFSSVHLPRVHSTLSTTNRSVIVE